MIQALFAHTNEIDDVEEAAAELLEQLNPGLLRHSAGIMYYHGDFAKTGVVRRLCEQLPFPVIGGTTCNSAIRGSTEDMALTITVLTSDDCFFTAGISEPIKDDTYGPLEKLYRKLEKSVPDGLSAGPKEKPAMLFIIAPYLPDIMGDDYVAALNGLSGGVPVFGSIASTHAADFKAIKTSFNGDEYGDALAVVALWGKVEPKFFLSTISDKQVLNHRAVITDSYRNRIKRINGIPAPEYLESIGLVKNGQLVGVDTFPLVLHPTDGSRLIRTFYEIEGDELLCSGAIPAGIAMEISFCDREFVIDSAKKTIKDCEHWLAEQGEAGRAALVISCVARRWTLGTDIFAEIRELEAELKKLPYLFAYSRGEFSPVSNASGVLVNYFFNYSMGICVL